MHHTEGHLLGGRVRYRQPATGFRSGIEPVLLAAAVPARAGERVLEGGSGAGAALLCLAARIPGLAGTGVERDPELAALASSNAEANRAQLAFLAAALEMADLPAGFDHAMANPPYHAAEGTASPDPGRDGAKRAPTGLLTSWIQCLGRPLRHLGSLTLILPAARLSECVQAFEAARCPATALYPLWPKAGRSAKLLLLQGRKSSRSALRVLPGLVLHRPDGGFTPDADAVLRDGAPIDLG